MRDLIDFLDALDRPEEERRLIDGQPVPSPALPSPELQQPSVQLPAVAAQPRVEPAAPMVAQSGVRPASDSLTMAMRRQNMMAHEPFVRSIWKQESAGGTVDTSRPNYAGAIGQMQITPPAFEEVKRRGMIPKHYEFTNPEHNTEAGVAYLKLAINMAGGDYRKAAAIYYGGPSAVKDGKIDERRADPVSGKTVGSYVADVTERMRQGGQQPKPAAAFPTSDAERVRAWLSEREERERQKNLTPLPQEVLDRWIATMATPEYKEAGGEAREQMRRLFAQQHVEPLGETAIRQFESKTAPKGFLKGLASGFSDFVEATAKAGVPALRLTMEEMRAADAAASLREFDKIDAGEKPDVNKQGVYLYLNASPERKAALRAEQTERMAKAAANSKELLGAMKKFEEEKVAELAARPSAGFTDIDWTKPGTWMQFKEWAGHAIGGTAVPTLAATIAAVVTRSPAAAAAPYFPVVFLGELQNRARSAMEQSKSPEETAKYLHETLPTSVASSAIQTALGTMGAPAVAVKALTQPATKGVARKYAGIVAGGTTRESITEGAEQAVSVGTARALGEREGPITEEETKEVIEAAAAGALVGGGVTASVTGPARAVYEHRAQKLRELASQLRESAAQTSPTPAGEPVSADMLYPQVGQQPRVPEGVPQQLDEIKLAEQEEKIKSIQRVADAFSEENLGARALRIRVLTPQEAAESGLDEKTEAIYFGQDREILVNPAAIESAERGLEVLTHEIVGHYGVEQIVAAAGPGFEQRWMKLLDDVARTRARGGYASMEEVARSYPGESRQVQAMEVLARMAETGVRHSLVTKVIALLRNALRAIGLNLSYRESDLRDLIVRARRGIREGTLRPSSEAAEFHQRAFPKPQPKEAPAAKDAAEEARLATEDEWASALAQDQEEHSALERLREKWIDVRQEAEAEAEEEAQEAARERFAGLWGPFGELAEEEAQQQQVAPRPTTEEARQATENEWASALAQDQEEHSALERLKEKWADVRKEAEAEAEEEARESALERFANLWGPRGELAEEAPEPAETAAVAPQAKPAAPAKSASRRQGVAKARHKKAKEALEKVSKRRGLRSIKPEEAIQNPNFVRWFGKSQTAEEIGGKKLPIIFFRGGRIAPEVFKPGKAGAIFFSTKPEFSEQFAENWDANKYFRALPAKEKSRVVSEFLQKFPHYKGAPTSELLENNHFVRFLDEHTGVGPNIGAYYIRAERPFRWWDNGDVETLVEEIKKTESGRKLLAGKRPPKDAEFARSSLSAEEEIASGNWTYLEDPAVLDAMKRVGFDGFYTSEGGADNIAVFSQNQIKSALANTGEFSTATPSVLRSAKPSLADIEKMRKERTAAIRANINKVFGKGVAERLEKMGILRIEGAIDHPYPDKAALISAAGAAWEGDPRGPGASIFWHRINPENAPIIFAHEVGEHYGMIRILGAGRYYDMLIELRRLKRTDPEVKAAWDFVEREYVGRGLDMETGDRRFMKEVAAQLVERLPENHTWLNKLFRAVRAFLYERLGIGKLSPELLRALAASAIRKAAAGKLQREPIGIYHLPPYVAERTSVGLASKKWRAENAAFEVANKSDSWAKLNAEEKTRVTKYIANSVAKDVVRLFTDAKFEVVSSRGGWMGAVSPNASIKSDEITKAQMAKIAKALAYVLDQEAVAHISDKGKAGSVTVIAPEGMDAEQLYTTLPDNTTTFIGFSSPSPGVLEFIVDNVSQAAPILAAHFKGAKIVTATRGVAFLSADKEFLNSLSKAQRERLELLKKQASAILKIAASPDREGHEIGTASITSDHLVGDGKKVDASLDSLFAAGPDAVETAAELLRLSPGIKEIKGETAAQTIERAVEFFKENLVAFYKAVNPETAKKTAERYISAHKIAKALAEEFDVPLYQAAGVIAALSPQKDWDQNISLARRVISIYKREQNARTTPAMIEMALADRTQQTAQARAAQERMAKQIEGKALSELENPLEAAAWIRAFDEAHNPRSYEEHDPSGEVVGLAVSNGAPLRAAWGNTESIKNAVRMLRGVDPSIALGDGHKVRSFYMNILYPERDGIGTIDSHAVAAAHLRPLSSESAEARNAFGGQAAPGLPYPPKSNVVGLNGVYPVYLEAYRRAAKAVGVKTRELQSVMWDAVRTLFSRADKKLQKLQQFNEQWRNSHDHDATRRQILSRIGRPAWERVGAGVDEATQATDASIGVPGDRGRPGQRAAGPRGRLASVAPEPAYSARTPQADSVALDVWHWSHSQYIGTLSGRMYGQGIKGAEAKRLQNAPDVLKRRVYFYTKLDNGAEPQKEAGLGPYKHVTRVDNIWRRGVSRHIDPYEKMVDELGWPLDVYTRWEAALYDAGYDGYVLDGVVVVLNSDIPVRSTQALKSVKPIKANGPIDGVMKLGFGWVGEHLTGPTHDYLIRTAGKLFSDKIKHGFISHYGLDSLYLHRRIERAANINRVLRETKNLLDSIAHLTNAEARIAYLWMSEKPNTELEAALWSQLPEQSKQTLLNMKKLIDELGRAAVSVGLLSPESYERNRMAYLHRSYEIHIQQNPDVELRLRRSAAIRAENFKGRGIRHDVAIKAKPGDMFTRWEYRAADGGILTVEYRPEGEPGPKGYVNAGTWEARFFDKPGKVGLWRDLTREERERLGEIEEVRFAFAKTVMHSIRDIENARFLRWVANKYSREDVAAEPANTDFFSTKVYGKDDYVEVPTVKIKGTNILKYGALSGKKIPGVVWNDIRTTFSLPESEAAEAWQNTLRLWKVAKTALTPAVHMNNIMSNFVLADMADVKARYIVKSIRTLLAAQRGDKAAQALIDQYLDSGAEHGAYVMQELRGDYIEPILKQLQGIQDNDLGRLTAVQAVSLIVHGQVGAGMEALKAKAAWLGAPIERLVSLYQHEDRIFRLAMFMQHLDAGETATQAGVAARDAFLDYDINAPFVDAARKSVLPFIAFSYRAIPKVIKTFAHKPWKIAKYFAVGSFLNAASYALLGLDDEGEERERALLPEELSGRIFGTFPRLIRLPWNDAHDSPVFLDVRRWFPGGDMIDLHQSKAAIPVPSWLSIAGPISVAAELFMNRSSFTGKPIVLETDSAAESMLKVSDHLFKAFAPNLPLPGPGTLLPSDQRGLLQTYAYQSILDAGTGRTDIFGRDLSMTQALLSSFGIKAKSYPEDVLRQNTVFEYRKQVDELRKTINQASRELQRNGISHDQFERLLEKQNEKLLKLNEELRNKLAGQKE